MMRTMPTSVTFQLTGLPPSANKRLHYMARHKKNQEWKAWSNLAIKDAVQRAGISDAPWARVHVLYVFHYPRITRADPDNLVGSAKPILDGLTRVIIPDDSEKHVHRIAAAVKVDRGQPAGVQVSIERCFCSEMGTNQAQ